jgi:hypothetical protein
VLDIKGDMRDWLGKGAKGEVAVRELAAQKERTKAVEMKLDATEMKLKLATDELQRLRDGMVRQQKRHAEEMADLQRAHQKEMSVFAKLVEVSFTFEGIFVSIRAIRMTSCCIHRPSGTNAKTKR